MNLDPAPPFRKLPAIAIIVVIIAFLMVASAILLSFIQNPLFALVLVPTSLIPIAAAIGILRKKVWSAYGFALYAAGNLFPNFLVKQSASIVGTIAAAGFNLLIAMLFFFAGRSLSKLPDARRGSPWPWIVLTCALTLPFLFFRAFNIPTGSMENTLLVGDHVIARVFPKPVPVRDSLLIFQMPYGNGETSIKRVIGLPGDRIRIASRVVYRNGVALNEPFVIHRYPEEGQYGDDLPGDITKLGPRMSGPGLEQMLQEHVSNGEVVVPPGKYFVLGDNRDNSLDSRYFGFVDHIIGVPLVIYYSGEPSDTEELGDRMPQRDKSVRWNRIFKLL